MIKLTISTIGLLLVGLFAKAQDFPVYQPVIDYSARRTGSTMQPNTDKEEAQIINAYAFPGGGKSPIRLKVKVVFGQMVNKVVAYKRLSDQYWVPLGGYVYRLDVNDKLADTFEYKGFINSMNIYF